MPVPLPDGVTASQRPSRRPSIAAPRLTRFANGLSLLLLAKDEGEVTMHDRFPQARTVVGGLAVLCLLLTCATSPAQQQAPQFPFARLFTIMPPGGKVGSAVEVTIGGADLEEAAALYFSHPGIKAERVPDPMKAGSFVANKFKVTIDGNVPLGIHDVRAIGRFGISNPRGFAVGDLNEVLEKEPNNDVPQAHKIELGTTVSGAISANVDVDYFLFAGKKGQRVVLACAAGSLDSRLDPQLQLFDPAGRQIAANRRYGERDAVADVILPADADYTVRLTQHAHIAGSAEYFYRLSVSLAPWIDAAYPPVVEPGKATAVTLFGRNLPNGQPDPKATVDGHVLDKLVVQVTSPAEPLNRQRLAYSGYVTPGAASLDGLEYRVKNAAGTSNPVLLTYASAPIILDNEDNDTPEKAQQISLPCEICGRIEKRRDRDWYVFSAKANEVFVFDAYCERLGSPVDLFFEIRRIDEKDPKNRPSVGEYDDNTEILHPLKFNTRNDDPKTRFVAPADGKYELMVSSRSADVSAGPRHIYRLSVNKEQPDFRLILVDHDDNDPSALNVRQGSSQYIHVLCQRLDGFTGEVLLSVEGLPAGITCPPQVLGANMKQTPLVLTATPDAAAWAGDVKIKGTATINGKPEVREARAGCVVWAVQPQQNVPTISRMARSIGLGVREKAPFGLESAAPDLSAPVGATVAVKLKVNRHWPEAKIPIQVVAVDLPPNVAFNNNNQPVTVAADKNEADLQIQVRNNVAPGVYNLVLRGAGQVPFNKDPKATQKPPLGTTVVSTPIKLTIYNTVAEVTLNNANVTLKAGMDAELLVKVHRLNGYQGEFKLQLVLPQGFQGVTAPEVTIPANGNEAKFVLKCAQGAAPATNPGVVVRAVATVDKITLNHDAKLAVTITK
jgi:hypothetical protein